MFAVPLMLEGAIELRSLPLSVRFYLFSRDERHPSLKLNAGEQYRQTGPAPDRKNGTAIDA